MWVRGAGAKAASAALGIAIGASAIFWPAIARAQEASGTVPSATGFYDYLTTNGYLSALGYVLVLAAVAGIFRRLKLPLDDQMRFVQKLVALHLRPIALTKDEVTDSAVRRLLFDAGDDIDALMILCRADITSKNEKKKERYLRNYEALMGKLAEVEQKDHVRNFQPPITGQDVMAAFGIEPCKLIGDIKTVIKDAILDGVIQNDRVQAWRLMLETGRKLGREPLAGMQEPIQAQDQEQGQ